MNKKIITIFVAIALLFALCVNASASSSQYIFEVGNVTVMLDPDNTLSERAKTNIVNYLTGNESGIATRSILCSVFGHKFETSTASRILHRVNTTAPRCKKETFEIETCTRCDYSSATLVSYEYIFCCPED